jgi:PII-like signaling protein
MRMTGQGKLLRILVGESDRVQGRPLYNALVEKARELGLAGATVWRGIEGFGARSRIHTARILRLSEDLPVVIEIVDTEEKIRDALPALDALMEGAGGGGLITLEAAEIIKYTHGNDDAPH